MTTGLAIHNVVGAIVKAARLIVPEPLATTSLPACVKLRINEASALGLKKRAASTMPQQVTPRDHRGRSIVRRRRQPAKASAPRVSRAREPGSGVDAELVSRSS